MQGWGGCVGQRHDRVAFFKTDSNNETNINEMLMGGAYL